MSSENTMNWSAPSAHEKKKWSSVRSSASLVQIWSNEWMHMKRQRRETTNRQDHLIQKHDKVLLRSRRMSQFVRSKAFCTFAPGRTVSEIGSIVTETSSDGLPIEQSQQRIQNRLVDEQTVILRVTLRHYQFVHPNESQLNTSSQSILVTI